jgi:hypothetical protein
MLEIVAGFLQKDIRNALLFSRDLMKQCQKRTTLAGLALLIVGLAHQFHKRSILVLGFRTPGLGVVTEHFNKGFQVFQETVGVASDIDENAR